MKTWHQFSQNLYFKIWVSLVFILLNSPFIFSQDKPLEIPSSGISYPGIYETFETLAQLDIDRLRKKATLLSKNSSLNSAIDLKQVRIDPDFMASALLHTQQSYLKLGSTQCHFYDLIITDLLKTAEGTPQRIFVKFKNKNNEDTGAIISKKEFLEKIAYTACPDSKNLIAKFQIKNLTEISQQLKVEHPSSLEQCDSMYNNWVQDPASPYYCQIHEKLEDAKKLFQNSESLNSSDKKLKIASEQTIALAKIIRSKFNDSQIDYLNQFCYLSSQKDLFCSDFFKTNFWTKANDSEAYDDYIKNICEAHLKKKWSPAVKRECLSALKRNDDMCLFKTLSTSALAPSPRCEQLSKALNYSSLKSYYDDCPRFSDQLAATNFSRVLRNFEPVQNKKYGGLCSVISAGTIYDFYKIYDSQEIWTSQLCYFDGIEQKEICYPVLMGDYENSEASLSTVAAKILRRTKGFTAKDTCKVIPSIDYRSTLLEFKTGCFIVLEHKKCAMGSCEFKVVWNERELKAFTVKPGLHLDYFPNSAASERFSLTYLWSRNETKITRSITSLSALIEFIKKSKKSLAHGIGCAEDLLPTFFKKTTLNQCSPMPFIIDGIIKEGEDVTLVTRSAVDDLQSPRLIPWSIIYSAVKMYQSHHPLRQWTLYGTY